MKTVKLFTTQIEQYWEIIKFAATTADEVDEKDLQPFLLELLHALLSNKAQCWVRINDEREIVCLLITRIAIDKITADKFLYLQCVFSYSQVPLEIWQKDFNLLLRFAKQENCKKITFESRHPKIWEITKSFGFREVYRLFAYDIR